MAHPFDLADHTANFALPLLFPGQTQKEFFVNQALTLLDTLLQQSVTASLPSPPPAPIEGEAYRVVSPASGEWSEHAASIAIFIGGSWSFIPPIEGMRMYDRAARQVLFYQNQWRFAAPPSIPDGGDTVDAEARATLTEVVEILRQLGLIASPPE